METSSLVIERGCSESTSQLRRITINNLEQYLRYVEPNHTNLYTDMRYLARYMVKFGYNVMLANTWLKKDIKPQNDPDIDLERIVALTSKYDLIWTAHCHKLNMDLDSNKSLYHVAATFPQQFIDVAAGLSPGSFDERRFWFCANNGQYWSMYPGPANHSKAARVFRYSPRRLLTDVLQVILTPNEPKLIRLSALRAVIRHSNDLIELGLYWENLEWISKIVEEDKWGKANEKRKTRLRTRYDIVKAEEELQPIDIESFVHWWNLTSLRN